MKKVIATLLIGSALSLTACANTERSADYGYEQNAPYADERTIGENGKPAPAQADRVFEQRQRK
ncbi:MAG: hypothetical protein CO093_02295 [Alphaproteobacteria bacterium CG_4_9_14_3_um_filter_47_13]|nr:MAG: hypothetical protein CO093_02295 [Alphaproteobacteria bacterium CG_4_9_14_3_um_filter_47_13]